MTTGRSSLRCRLLFAAAACPFLCCHADDGAQPDDGTAPVQASCVPVFAVCQVDSFCFVPDIHSKFGYSTMVASDFSDDVRKCNVYAAPKPNAQDPCSIVDDEQQLKGSVIFTKNSVEWQFIDGWGGTDFAVYAGPCQANTGNQDGKIKECKPDAMEANARNRASFPLVSESHDPPLPKFIFDFTNKQEYNPARNTKDWPEEYDVFPLGEAGTIGYTKYQRDWLTLMARACPLLGRGAAETTTKQPIPPPLPTPSPAAAAAGVAVAGPCVPVFVVCPDSFCFIPDVHDQFGYSNNVAFIANEVWNCDIYAAPKGADDPCSVGEEAPQRKGSAVVAKNKVSFHFIDGWAGSDFAVYAGHCSANTGPDDDNNMVVCTTQAMKDNARNRGTYPLKSLGHDPPLMDFSFDLDNNYKSFRNTRDWPDDYEVFPLGEQGISGLIPYQRDFMTAMARACPLAAEEQPTAPVAPTDSPAVATPELLTGCNRAYALCVADNIDGACYSSGSGDYLYRADLQNDNVKFPVKCQLIPMPSGTDCAERPAPIGTVTIKKKSVLYQIDNESGWGGYDFAVYAGACDVNDGGVAWRESGGSGAATVCSESDIARFGTNLASYPLRTRKPFLPLLKDYSFASDGSAQFENSQEWPSYETLPLLTDPTHTSWVVAATVCQCDTFDEGCRDTTSSPTFADTTGQPSSPSVNLDSIVPSSVSPVASTGIPSLPPSGAPVQQDLPSAAPSQVPAPETGAPTATTQPAAAVIGSVAPSATPAATESTGFPTTASGRATTNTPTRTAFFQFVVIVPHVTSTLEGAVRLLTPDEIDSWIELTQEWFDRSYNERRRRRRLSNYYYSNISDPRVAGVTNMRTSITFAAQELLGDEDDMSLLLTYNQTLRYDLLDPVNQPVESIPKPSELVVIPYRNHTQNHVYGGALKTSIPTAFASLETPIDEPTVTNVGLPDYYYGASGKEDNDDGGMNAGSIAGIAIASLALLALLVICIVQARKQKDGIRNFYDVSSRRLLFRRCKNQEEEFVPTMAPKRTSILDRAKPPTARQEELETRSRHGTSTAGSSSSTVDASESVPPTRTPFNISSDMATTTLRPAGVMANVHEDTYLIEAPPGKLGVIIDNCRDGSTRTRVDFVKDHSVLLDQGIQVGDGLIAVDGRNVRNWKAIDVAKLLYKRRDKRVRRLLMVREQGSAPSFGSYREVTPEVVAQPTVL